MVVVDLFFLSRLGNLLLRSWGDVPGSFRLVVLLGVHGAVVPLGGWLALGDLGDGLPEELVDEGPLLDCVDVHVDDWRLLGVEGRASELPPSLLDASDVPLVHHGYDLVALALPVDLVEERVVPVVDQYPLLVGGDHVEQVHQEVGSIGVDGLSEGLAAPDVKGLADVLVLVADSRPVEQSAASPQHPPEPEERRVPEPVDSLNTELPASELDLRSGLLGLLDGVLDLEGGNQGLKVGWEVYSQPVSY